MLMVLNSIIGRKAMKKIQKTEAQWLQQLGEEGFRICRQKGTEPAFSGRYWDAKGEGAYKCRCCAQTLFDSATKYDSGSGWPSYYQPVSKDVVTMITDDSHGMRRVEVICAACDSHLGHVFEDGPQPTGLRYCINSASLNWVPS